MSANEEGRLYRFGVDDRVGWILGLQGAQCVAIASGLFGAAFLLNLGVPPALTLLPLVLALAVSFVPVAGRPLWSWLPVVSIWHLRRAERHWRMSLPRWFADGRPAPDRRLPSVLAGLEVESHDLDWSPRGRVRGSAGVVRDQRDGSVMMTIRVAGQGFALLERRDQDRLLGGWGEALGACCRERTPVRSVRWIEWAAPSGVSAQLDYLEAHRASDASTPGVRSYRELLERSGPIATSHETLVCVTVDPKHVRSGRSDRAAGGASSASPRSVRSRRQDRTVDALAEEVRLLVARLETAGLVVEGPLRPDELAEVVRYRLDPFGSRNPAEARRSLTQLVDDTGTDTQREIGPMALDAAWDHVRVDRTFHQTMAITEWPRLDVAANWMEPLLLGGAAIRSIAMVLEPIAPSRAQRRVDRDSTRLSSDAEQRNRSGFRIGARHRRAEREVAERESELVAGFAEFEFAGVITVAAPDLPTLDRHAAETEQLAAQAGLTVRSLDAQHDLALLMSVPLGRGIAPRRSAW